MQRTILGFGRDAEGDWAARLACGHNRHVRHRPPFINRPWVIHAAGRASWLGRSFDCLRCDRLEWPVRILEHRPPDEVFNLDCNDELPRSGAPNRYWQKIEIESGRAMLFIDTLQTERSICPGSVTAIPPTLAFHLLALTTVRGRIRSYRLI
jgi:hypothetical protein